MHSFQSQHPFEGGFAGFAFVAMYISIFCIIVLHLVVVCSYVCLLLGIAPLVHSLVFV